MLNFILYWYIIHISAVIGYGCTLWYDSNKMQIFDQNKIYHSINQVTNKTIYYICKK